MKNKIIILSLLIGNILFSQINEHKTYYENGNIKEIGSYINSLKEGSWKTYFENGQIMEEGSYKNGLRDGEWKEYYENGQADFIASYKKGMANGNVIAYHENGEIRATAYLIDEVPEGITKQYNQDGNLLESGSFSKGEKVGVWTKNEYYDNGKLKEHAEYLDDKKHGKYESYYENGQLSQDAYYKNGNLEGDYKSFYKNGNLQETGKAIDGEIDGKYLSYHENGKVWKEQYFKLGEKHGLSKRYYENGNLRDTGDYVDDRKDGFWREYDEKGYGWEGNYILSVKNGIWKFFDVSRDETKYLSISGEYIKGKKEGLWQEYLSDGSASDYSIYINDDIDKHFKNGKHYLIEDMTIVGYEMWDDNILIDTIRYEDEIDYYKIKFKNNCDEEIDVVVRIMNEKDEWENCGWYNLKPGKTGYLEDTKNRIIYYYAESDNHVWSGEVYRTYKGENFGFKKVELKKGEYGERTIYISCDEN